ncbi:MAG: lipid-A-disaccharide synthase [Planctomycetota bacterium]|jgi:lipid-A-disaccharide synthase
MAGKRIFLSVGDDSGDLHGASLMRAIRELDPDAGFTGFGMARMAEAGLELLESDGAQDSAMWLHNVLRIGRFRRRLALCRAHFQSQPPDLVVPVDFGGFNLYVCREAARLGIPVFYYIPPQVWAHGRYRLKKLRKWVTRAGLIYPFEPWLYRRYGVDAEYVGHPFFDQLESCPPSEQVVSDLKARFGDCLIGVFPGSRRQEVRANLPIIMESCRQIRVAVPEATFALRCMSRMRPLVDELLEGASGDIAVLDEVRPTELARASRICITKSGTIALEIASQRTPMVIFYRLSGVVAFVGWGLSHTPYLGLINVLAGREICPELPMSRDDPGWVTRHALRLLQDHEAYAVCKEAIGEALAGFAEPGASARAARSALELV